MTTSLDTHRLGDLIRLEYGKGLPAHSRRAGRYKVFGSNGIVGTHNAFLVEGPGIVVGRKGSVGEVAFSEAAFWPIDTTYYVANPQQHSWRFLYFLLKQIDLTDLNSHSAVPGLNRESVYQLRCAIPPRDEQERVAGVLTLVERALALEKRGLGLANELKQAAMLEVFSSGVSGEATIETAYGPLPQAWPTRSLGDCCVVQAGITKGRSVAPEDAVEVPYLRVANVQDGRLDLTTIKTIVIRKSELSKYLLRKGDVLLTEGGDLDKLGRGFLWRSQLPVCVHQNHVFAVRPDPTVLLPEFLAYLAQSPYGRAYFLSVAHKTTNLASINQTKLRAFPVPAPPLDTQRQIVALLSVTDEKIQASEKRVRALSDLLQTLLRDLVGGSRQVPELGIDLSEV